MSASWYYQLMGDEVGPLTSAELLRLAREGTVTPDMIVRRGDYEWVTASSVKGLFEGTASTPPNVNRPDDEAQWLPPGLGLEQEESSDPSSWQTKAAQEGNLGRPATKNCPFCGETILAVAIKCKHCNEFLDERSSAAPMVSDDASDVIESMQELKSDDRERKKETKPENESQTTQVLGGCIFLFVCMFAICAGCLRIFDSSPSTRSNSEFDSVRRDMDKFDQHFPGASEEERRLTEELFEQDSRRRGY